MTKETPKTDATKAEVTQEGAVELQEDQLDEAQGGILIGLNQPTGGFKLPAAHEGIKLTSSTDVKLSTSRDIFKF
jgi:hypothetical protein